MIKNIIFDFGNVLIDLDLPKTTIELSKFLKQKVSEQHRKYLDEMLFNVYEVGGMNEQEFLDGLRYHAEVPATTNEIKDAWNAMLLGIPKHRFDFLRSLSNYRIFLLSNTNATHLDWVDAHLQRDHDMNTAQFDAFFEKAYYSHLINLRKPGTEIYEFVLKDADLKAEETLFIDDNAENIEGAKQVGLQTLHLGIEEEVATAIQKYLVL